MIRVVFSVPYFQNDESGGYTNRIIKIRDDSKPDVDTLVKHLHLMQYVNDAGKDEYTLCIIVDKIGQLQGYCEEFHNPKQAVEEVFDLILGMTDICGIGYHG